ncbi:MAG TPA: ABC-type transport auxiliary lipoprotein family protein [Byssovorax sp.]
MTQRSILSALALALAALTGAPACALTSKADALPIRYFTPDSGSAAPATARAPAEAGLELRLGRVTSGASLRERIAHRDAAHEVGFYDERRWTARPEGFARRRLERALFEERGLTHVVSGDAPILDVDVVSFEELRLPDRHGVRVELHVTLSDGRRVLYEGTEAVERPLAQGADIGAIVTELSRALEVASIDVARRVSAALRDRAPTTATATTR